MSFGQGSAYQVYRDGYDLPDLPDRRDPVILHAAPDPVDDFHKLRRILSASRTPDSYCRSALYFAFTGRAFTDRGKVWTVKCNDSYLILLPHPNQEKTLLVFFPFSYTVSDFSEQIRTLCDCGDFFDNFNELDNFTFHEVLLARIPDSISHGIFQTEWPSLRGRLERMDEKKLDWVYPSYDVDLRKLVKPEGGKLKTFRKKINKFKKDLDGDIEVIRARRLSQEELKKAVSQVNKSWIRTKLKSGVSLKDQGITLKDLMEPYRTLARLNRNLRSQIDGLIMRRGTDYIAFSFWERPANKRAIVPCFAALPCSYEKGLSEYLYHCIADHLAREGYQRMCIGGSETASLDQFKQKLGPVAEHKLQTIRFLPRQTSAVEPHSTRTVASIGAMR